MSIAIHSPSDGSTDCPGGRPPRHSAACDVAAEDLPLSTMQRPAQGPGPASAPRAARNLALGTRVQRANHAPRQPRLSLIYSGDWGGPPSRVCTVAPAPKYSGPSVRHSTRPDASHRRLFPFHSTTAAPLRGDTHSALHISSYCCPCTSLVFEQISLSSCLIPPLQLPLLPFPRRRARTNRSKWSRTRQPRTGPNRTRAARRSQWQR